MYEPIIYINIYGDIIEDLLNIVAMISNHEDYKYIPYLGALLGLMAMAIRGAFKMGAFDPRWFLVGIIAWTALFEAKTTVWIGAPGDTDFVTKVDNVPAGVAYPAAITTSVANAITTLFETGHTTLNGGSSVSTMKALDIMLHMRKMTDGNTLAALINNTSTGNVYENFREYFDKCFLHALDFDDSSDKGITINKLLNEPFNLSMIDIKWPLGTAFISDGSGTRNVDCTTAYGIVAGQLGYVDPEEGGEDSESMSSVMTDIVNAVYKEAVPNADRNLGKIYTDATVQQIFGNWGTEAVTTQNVMQNLVASELMRKTAEGSDASSSELLVAKYIADSREQEFYTSAAKKESWQQRLIQGITFIQALVFSLFPLMALSLFIGAAGVQVIGGYLKILWWLVFWGPVAVILDNIIMLNVMETYTNMSYAAGGYEGDVGSWAQVNNLYKDASQWYNIGATFYVMIPILTWHFASASFDGMVNAVGKIAENGASSGGVEGAAPTKGVNQYGDATVVSSPATGFSPTLLTGERKALEGSDVELKLSKGAGQSAGTEVKTNLAEEHAKNLTDGSSTDIGNIESLSESVAGKGSKTMEFAKKVTNAVKTEYNESTGQQLSKAQSEKLQGQLVLGLNALTSPLMQDSTSTLLQALSAGDLPFDLGSIGKGGKGKDVTLTKAEKVGMANEYINALKTGSLPKNSILKKTLGSNKGVAALMFLGEVVESVVESVANNSGIGYFTSAENNESEQEKIEKSLSKAFQNDEQLDDMLEASLTDEARAEDSDSVQRKNTKADSLQSLVRTGFDLIATLATSQNVDGDVIESKSYNTHLVASSANQSKRSELINKIKNNTGDWNGVDEYGDLSTSHQIIKDLEEGHFKKVQSVVRNNFGAWARSDDKNLVGLANAFIQNYEPNGHQLALIGKTQDILKFNSLNSDMIKSLLGDIDSNDPVDKVTPLTGVGNTLLGLNDEGSGMSYVSKKLLYGNAGAKAQELRKETPDLDSDRGVGLSTDEEKAIVQKLEGKESYVERYFENREADVTVDWIMNDELKTPGQDKVDSSYEAGRFDMDVEDSLIRKVLDLVSLQEKSNPEGTHNHDFFHEHGKESTIDRPWFEWGSSSDEEPSGGFNTPSNQALNRLYQKGSITKKDDE